jgi:hypothetical protein
MRNASATGSDSEHLQQRVATSLSQLGLRRPAGHDVVALAGPRGGDRRSAARRRVAFADYLNVPLEEILDTALAAELGRIASSIIGTRKENLPFPASLRPSLQRIAGRAASTAGDFGVTLLMSPTKMASSLSLSAPC